MTSLVAGMARPSHCPGNGRATARIWVVFRALRKVTRAFGRSICGAETNHLRRDFAPLFRGPALSDASPQTYLDRGIPLRHRRQ
jgi:hypothetical protein